MPQLSRKWKLSPWPFLFLYAICCRSCDSPPWWSTDGRCHTGARPGLRMQTSWSKALGVFSPEQGMQGLDGAHHTMHVPPLWPLRCLSNGRRLRNYGITDLPPSLPVPPGTVRRGSANQNIAGWADTSQVWQPLRILMTMWSLKHVPPDVQKIINRAALRLEKRVSSLEYEITCMYCKSESKKILSPLT